MITSFGHSSGVKFLCGLLLFVCQSAIASPTIEYWHMNANKAVVKIDGKVRFLYPGETSDEGVTLVSVDPREIVVKMDDRRYRFAKGSDKGELLEDEVLIRRSDDNTFVAECEVNGKAVRMLVDTGASAVIFNRRDARRLGIRYKKRLDNLYVFQTAGGEVLEAYRTEVDYINIVDISVANVEVYVSDNDLHPPMSVLGMTFLKGVTFVVRGDTMLITP